MNSRTPTSSRSGDDRVEHGVVAARHEVVVVEHARASTERELAHADARGRVHVFDFEPAPDRVQRREPAEQVAADGAATRHPLEQVVMRVDEAGGDDPAVAVEHLVARGSR